MKLVRMVLVYTATLTEVIVAELQMEQLRDTGTSLMGLKLGVTHCWILASLEISFTEIGLLE